MKSPLVLAVAAISASLLLSGCGGGGGSDSSGSSSSSSGSSSGSSSSSSSSSGSSGGSSSSSSSSGSSSGSSGSSGGQGGTFAKAYQYSNKKVRGRPLLAMPDGGFLYYAKSIGRGLLARLDNNGQIVWSRYTDTAYYEPNWIEAEFSDDGDLLLVGETDAIRGGIYNEFGVGSVKFNVESGEIKYAKFLEAPGFTTDAQGIIENDSAATNDSLVFANRTTRPHLYTYHTDRQLNYLWSKEVTTEDNPIALTTSDDLSTFVATSSDLSVPDTANIHKFDRDGNILFQKAYGFGADNSHLEVFNINTLKNSDLEGGYQIIIHGVLSKENNGGGDKQNLFFSIDPSGNYLWGFKTLISDTLVPRYVTSSGELFVSGMVNSKPTYATLTTDGTFSSIRSIEQDFIESIGPAIELLDGGTVMLIDTTDTNEDYVDILVKISSSNELPNIGREWEIKSSAIEINPLSSTPADLASEITDYLYSEPVELEFSTGPVELQVTELTVN